MTGPQKGPQNGRSRTFGPVIVLGLASGVVVAVAGNQAATAAAGERAQSFAAAGFVIYDARMPAATAAALVVLACWGVVLVSRGWFRRATAALGALAAAGAVAAVAAGGASSAHDLRRSFSEAGYVGVVVHHTAWFWTAALGSVLTLVASVLAVRLIPQWPEMGTRYDAPTGAGTRTDIGQPSPVEQLEDQTSIDLWKAFDEGRDPTA